MNFCNFIVVLFCTNYCYCWDTDQLEVFDVVEEVKVNFYDALNVSQSDNSAVIRSAFRKQSLLLHPDKNLDVDTSEKFRHLVSIYEILKNPSKRKYYDEILVNGLPNWRSAVYYYRHVRRMGLLEMILILFCIVTFGQYIISWAAYLEKKYNLEQIRGRKQKKTVISVDLMKPSFKNTLPFQIPKGIYNVLKFIPIMTSYFKEKALEKVEAVIYKEEMNEEIVLESKPVRRRKPAFVLPEGPTFEVHTMFHSMVTQDENSVPLTGGLWTDDDLEQLITLVKKYPGGTPGRWELIAEALKRSVPEVTYMANKMKNNGYKLPSKDDNTVEQPKIKQKTKGGKLGTEQQQINTWSQSQQKALEDALLKYPKGSLERWDRISDCVHNKTKEECILRYKTLVEAVKYKKGNNIQNTM